MKIANDMKPVNGMWFGIVAIEIQGGKCHLKMNINGSKRFLMHTS